MVKLTIIVPNGAVKVTAVGRDIAVHQYANGDFGIAHNCKMIGEDQQLRHAPILDWAGGHQILQREPLTITPSIQCSDCGLHGFITNDVWRDC